MNLSRMSNDELRINAEACRRIMAKRPETAASHKLAARQFLQYAAELHARAQCELIRAPHGEPIERRR